MMSENIRALLVDDEPLALRGLSLRLEKHDDVDVVGTCRNGREAIKAVKTDRPDVIFLDIQMPGLDGFAVVESLMGESLPLVVFVTAYDEYAIKAFEANAVDYLLKPVEEARLDTAIQQVRERLGEKRAVERNRRLLKALHELGKASDISLEDLTAPSVESPYEQRINIKDRGQITCVDVDDIGWIDAAGDYMCIHANGETHILRETMKNLERRLDPKKFQRVHRSTIVNLDQVKELHPYTNGECFLVLKSGGEVKVSRSYRGVVNRFL